MDSNIVEESIKELKYCQIMKHLQQEDQSQNKNRKIKYKCLLKLNRIKISLIINNKLEIR